MVSQDVRGRFGSEGTFVHMRPFNPNKGPKDTDESSDAWDTIDWLVKNTPNNNGKVGMFGISYPGFYTSMGMIDSHPALKAASPQAPITDWFIGDDIHHNGAFFLSQNFGFFWWFELPSEDPLRDAGRKFVFNNADGYDFFLRMGSLGNSESLHFKKRVPIWTEFLDHPNYDAYWQARNIRPHLKNVRCAVLTVGGWFDGEDLFGALETYRWTEKLNPGITNLLVMGPWTHGQWSHGPGNRVGDVDFHVKTGEHYREKIELPFFRQFLKGDTNRFQPEAQLFETGTHRWRRFESWPPTQSAARSLYFHPGGRLVMGTPPPASDSGADEFPSDPAKPVPFSQEVTTDYPRGYPTHDQRFAASRPDVLVYETEPLEEDLTLAGPIQASLHVATTGTDADWVVKVVDVYPPDFPDLHAAGYLAHLPPRPSGSGSGPEQLVPAGGPQSADLHPQYCSGPSLGLSQGHAPGAPHPRESVGTDHPCAAKWWALNNRRQTISARFCFLTWLQDQMGAQCSDSRPTP